jgi:hypothetical protein
MSRIVGIDLGTTNSLVAYMEDGFPKVIPDREGRPLLPSVVAFTPGGVLVGESAKRQLVKNPGQTIYSVKRFMGKGYDDVKEELRYFPFHILPSQEMVRIKVGDREVTPPEVSALILRALGERDGPTSVSRLKRRSSRSPLTSTTASVRPPRMPGALPGSRSSASSMSRRPPRWPTGSRSSRRGSWRFMTWVAAPLTSRS